MRERLVVDSIMTADGCELAFGEGYTSRLIHNDLGFGYAVCPRCYEAEFREMGESCDL